MEKLFEDFPKIANTITELTKIAGLEAEYEILVNSERKIEQTNYDNWNGGTSFYTIYLSTAIDIYSKHEARLEKIESIIKSKFEQIFKNYPSNVVGNVVITPRLLHVDVTPSLKATLDKYAFISYQTKDKIVAGSIRQLLEGVGIRAFLAHDDIEVSAEWQERILEEISRASIFICLLSNNYLSSPWCIQESGMAVLKNITIIPLSLDDTVPVGFVSKYQAIRIDGQRPRVNDLLPGLLKYNKFEGLNIIIELIGASGSFRMAEQNFELILSYLDNLTELQIRNLLKKIRENNQIHHASLCARDYIPPLLRKYKNLISEENFGYLKNICLQYGGIV